MVKTLTIMTTTINTSGLIAVPQVGIEGRYLVYMKDFQGAHDSSGLIGRLSFAGTAKVPVFEQTVNLKICAHTAKELVDLLEAAHRQKYFESLTIEVNTEDFVSTMTRLRAKFLKLFPNG